MSETFVTKFETKEFQIHAKITWDDNDSNLFNITIYEGFNGWSGRFSKEFATQFSENLMEPLTEYSSNVKSAIQGLSDIYTYDFTVLKDDNAKFSWKKKLEGNIGTILHGSVPVHKDNNTNKDAFINELLTENKNLKDQVQDTNKKNNELTTSLEKCKIELDQYIDLKTSLERSLYGKFVTVLNTKKRRIQLLETQISKIAKGDSALDDNEVD